MKVSVICLADRPERLPLLVWSMVAQTFTDWELLILDQTNGPQDVDMYVSALPFGIGDKVKLLKCDREGDWGQTVKNRAAREFATGDAFIFPNDDAYYVPTALAEMAAVLDKGCDIVVCSWLYDFMGYVPMPPSTREGYIDIGGFMVNRQLFNKVEWADRSQVGDAKLVAACIEAGGVVGTCSGVLYVKN